MAVSLVLLDHLLEAFQAAPTWWIAQRLSWAGVMLFFVHTSLVLLFSLDRTKAAGKARLQYFYVRRLFRIYPLSIGIVLLILAFHISVAHWRFQGTPTTPSTVLSNLLLIQNLTYAPSILGPLWSLPLEIQMYALLPLLYWAVRKGTRLNTALMLWLASIVFAFIQPHISERANIFQYAPCFLGGVIAFCLSKRRRASLPFWMWAITLFTSIGVFLYFTSTVDSDRLMHASWILSLVIGWILPSFAETSSPVVRRISALIAKYSYSIYLTHMIALWVVFAKLEHANPAVRFLTGAGLLVGLPIICYHLIEAPGIKAGARVAKRLLPSPPRAFAATT